MRSRSITVGAAADLRVNRGDIFAEQTDEDQLDAHQEEQAQAHW